MAVSNQNKFEEMATLEFEFKASDIIRDGRVKIEEIKEIRGWLPTENLPAIPDEMIAVFVIACENNMALTKSAIKAYFVCKKNSPELFTERDIDSDSLTLTSNTIFASSIPVRTDDNFVVHFFKLNDPKYYNFDLYSVMKIAYMIIDITINTPSPPNGIKVVIDTQGAGIMHLTRVRIKAVKKFIAFLQEAMPLRITVVHIINTIYFMDKILSIVKPFMKPELLQFLKLHPGNTNMQEFFKNEIPAKCVPCDYGGELPPFAELNQITIERLRQLRPYFTAEEALVDMYHPKNV